MAAELGARVTEEDDQEPDWRLGYEIVQESLRGSTPE